MTALGESRPPGGVAAPARARCHRSPLQQLHTAVASARHYPRRLQAGGVCVSIWDAMRRRFGLWPIAGVGAILGALVLVWVHAAHRVASRPAAARTGKLIGFYEDSGTSGRGQGSWPAFQRHVGHLDMVSPFWYRMDQSGNISNVHPINPRVVALAHAHHVKVLPLVANAGFMMLDPGTRPHAVAAVAQQVRRHGYDGAFIDFELLPMGERDNFAAFVAALSTRLHQAHKELGVTVFPKVGSAAGPGRSYDYAVIGKRSDHVLLMAYDEHQDAGPAGPVASIRWVRAGLRRTLVDVPAGHLYLGLAQYGYDWVAPGSAATVSTKQAAALARRQGVSVAWDPTYAEPHFRYTDAAGRIHDVWYEDAASAKMRYDLARSMGAIGVGMWRLNFEQPAFWSKVKAS